MDTSFTSRYEWRAAKPSYRRQSLPFGVEFCFEPTQDCVRAISGNESFSAQCAIEYNSGLQPCIYIQIDRLKHTNKQTQIQKT